MPRKVSPKQQAALDEHESVARVVEAEADAQPMQQAIPKRQAVEEARLIFVARHANPAPIGDSDAVEEVLDEVEAGGA